MYARFFSSTPTHPPQKEVRMSVSAWIRQFHRWLAIIFTLIVIANFAVRVFGEPPAWIALPYVAKFRRA
jgi:hypothetical protein